MSTTGSTTSAASPGRGRRRLHRVSRGRVLAGVARGLAMHLGVDVAVVRVAFVLLALAGGAGVAMYAAFWVLAPLDDTAGPDPEAERRELGYLLALGALGLGGLMLVSAVGIGSDRLMLPFFVAGFGVVILWRQADDAQRQRWRAATRASRRAGVLRTVSGAALVCAGAVVLLALRGDLSAVREGLAGAAVVLLGLGLISGPWWIRMGRDLSAERAARIREQERAEVAAHVHDSVLQTLTLIQRNVDDPREVARLARAQERDLRAWLYHPGADPDTTVRAALERAAADVEDAHGVAVEVVVVGDCPLDERLRALLLAAREAMVNAAKYAGEQPISVFAEVEPAQVAVFVRDRGPGFDIDGVPVDRLGVRRSVIGRMERNGGHATVRSTIGEGTEVQLEMPRETTDRRTTKGSHP